MKLDQYKRQFAEAASSAFGKKYPDLFKDDRLKETLSNNGIYNSLEKPKDPKMGRFAFPIFSLVKIIRTSPTELSSSLSAEINTELEAQNVVGIKAVGVGGYINAMIEAVSEAKVVLENVLLAKGNFGDSEDGQGKTVLVEYSAPNIAKPFGVGHLRSTIIGNSLRLIFKKLGYNSIGMNYPGDWGTQFGKMIVAYQKWGSETTLQGDAVRNLLELYVRFHQDAENDKSLDDDARVAFKKLEDAAPDAVSLWEQFKKISYAEFDRIYSVLGVEFDVVYGESFLNDKMDAVIERLTRNNLTSMSQGALIVDLHDPQLPPALLRKGDGATLYLTRDLANVIYRWNTYHFDQVLYIVGSSQADHFKQMIKVIEMMEEAENLPKNEKMADRIHHAANGWVKFEGKAMKTRMGTTIFLEDVIDEAVNLAKEKIIEKNPDLKNIDETAKMIGVGAVIFSQLSVRRLKDVNFSWEGVLNFEGETGPYLQYTHARLCSLIRNYGKKVSPEIDFSLLDREEEHRVIGLLAEFPDSVRDAAKLYDPYIITDYLLQLTGAFNKFYQRKDERGRTDKIISDNLALTDARMGLVESVRIVLHEGLRLLGLLAPEEM
jgi:arginyl-tRNA synthetase